MNNAPAHPQSDASAQFSRFRPAAVCRYGNTGIIIFLACYFFLIPFGLLLYYLSDPGLKGSQVPRFAFSLHRSLARRYEEWARQRIASGKAQQLGLEEISATEWPLFGSAFYLWATEGLQEAWEKDNSLSPVAPKIYAVGSIEAAAALMADPGHASWVKKHWGDEYLQKENVFYRMLLISGLTSYQKLLDKPDYLPLLSDQVETLSRELDASHYGLLNDYPNQCYPTDVLAAIAAIRQADEVLATDHSDFAKRSIRGFQDELLDSLGLPPYEADADRGRVGRSRGCSNAWALIWAPQLWPESASRWYDNYEKYFWQSRCLAVGFREFSKDTSEDEWFVHVDAGPVVAGFGTAASVFGIGAARANGRFDHAYPMSAEALVISWPLLDGSLLGPRLLSDMTDAPYLGEAASLFALTRQPAPGLDIIKAGRLPTIVYLVLGLYLAIGLLLLFASLRALRLWRRRISAEPIPLGRIQLAIWLILVTAGVVVCYVHGLPLGLLLILLAQFLPRFEKKIPRQANSK